MGLYLHCFLLNKEKTYELLMQFGKKWGSYKQAINSAKTLAELQEINIDYSEFKIKEGENS